jgi:multicomponent Na+:H+ antiporter subunit F
MMPPWLWCVVFGAGMAILVGMLLLLSRALLGPTVFDRILAVNALGTKTVLFMALWGFMVQRPEWLDTALLYALLNFIATIAILRLYETKKLG